MSEPQDDLVDREVEIERLANLEFVDYEVARTDAAKRLGMRASALDAAVKVTQRKLGLEKPKDEGQGRAVSIVDPPLWPEHVGGDLLATVLRCALRTYVITTDEESDAIVLWILHTWLVNEFACSPRLGIGSPTKGCGKTTLLNFLSKVTRRPKRSGSITPAAIFRLTELHQPTLLLDENEKYLEAGSDMHALLNEGHTRGATVIRVLGDNQELREFGVYGAMAIAYNGKLPDDLEQRCISISLQRKSFADEVLPFRHDRCENLDRLASMAARWASDQEGQAIDIDPEMYGLINRFADNWRPLFAIAEFLGGDWPDHALAAARALTPRESESIGPMLLADIKSIFDEKSVEKLLSADIVDTLVQWKDDLGQNGNRARRSRPINSPAFFAPSTSAQATSETARTCAKDTPATSSRMRGRPTLCPSNPCPNRYIATMPMRRALLTHLRPLQPTRL